MLSDDAIPAAASAEPDAQIAPIDRLEAAMLDLPQVECPVEHFFGNKTYMRQARMPGGTIALGHCHKHEHTNILLAGAIALVNSEGQVEILRAPIIFPGFPGRKFAYIIEDTTWVNIFATEERDLEKLAEELVDKSDTWKKRDADLHLQKIAESLPIAKPTEGS